MSPLPSEISDNSPHFRNLKAMVQRHLTRIGVEEANVEIELHGMVMITLETGVYAQVSHLLEAWYIVARQDDQQTVLMERKRGTGNTVA